MSGAVSLRRQILLSLSIMALGVILLSIVGSYAFYAIASTLAPGSISETWVPSGIEMLWMAGTILVALCIAGYVGVRLSRRILTPLNSVAHSLREIAQGNLQARAAPDDRALGEAGQLVRDFNAMAERLQSVTREQQFWNAAVAHELRTPVTILRGRLQGLAEGVFTPSTETFEGLLRQVEGLGRLIEDLRVLSLGDSDHLQLDQANTCPAEGIAATVQAFAGRLQARGFELQLQLDEQTCVVCDEFRLRQALIALLENTLAHADAGPLRIEAGVVNDSYQLSITDSGPGIDTELASQVFEAFRRGDPSRSRNSGGSGLGLAVVRAIAQAHGGQARCERAGGGTRFVVQLPLAHER
ncbi:two-component sensor histidine kinase [Pseudomonas straminea]|uniref:histidine kinase n=1 Tax=Pseudomonas straminea TaxID=47882 RepID=A0A1I1WPE8_PSEOC|nr:ATP-binding protein [Pseudomonas straminea]GLX15042.1 two-component sensor histidine kinase [Pseudomonas straminea]SFD96942.1 two-component system, OmpR family, sensor histidine kinase AdeS [Pseudomonas straminea]